MKAPAMLPRIVPCNPRSLVLACFSIAEMLPFGDQMPVRVCAEFEFCSNGAICYSGIP
jgi:hypothetical protein